MEPLDWTGLQIGSLCYWLLFRRPLKAFCWQAVVSTAVSPAFCIGCVLLFRRYPAVVLTANPHVTDFWIRYCCFDGIKLLYRRLIHLGRRLPGVLLLRRYMAVASTAFPEYALAYSILPGFDMILLLRRCPTVASTVNVLPLLDSFDGIWLLFRRPTTWKPVAMDLYCCFDGI